MNTDLQSEGGRGKRMRKNVEAQGPDGKHQVVKQIYLESQRERERTGQEITAPNFPKYVQNINLQSPKSEKIPSKIKTDNENRKRKAKWQNTSREQMIQMKANFSLDIGKVTR